MSHVSEFFGFPVTDVSAAAIGAARNLYCPFLDRTCVKTLSDGLISGACAIKPANSPAVICCPNRLYAENYSFLLDVAARAFPAGLELVPGPGALTNAQERGQQVIGVFGKRWGGELRLPQRSGVGNYFVDWILALVDPVEGLTEFVAVEVQTIDTTGNYRASRTALLENREIAKSSAGLNWENVNKRILPQLIYKGQVLQREEGCKKGLFFVSPTPVYDRVMRRLGGEEGLTKYHLQPASITFMSYDYGDSSPQSSGQPMPLNLDLVHSTTVYKVQERFNNVELPSPNVYRDAIIRSFS
ncbi:NotI family restriction endonuclease [Arthrobacter sp. IK3]|uniref:NotI family restriction endonuclease n=1 Tax=Arthrobacter sp. IK3 TaxID=3448169 RepID=UPI003EE1BD18